MAPTRTSKAAKKKECYSQESLPGFVNNICEGCGVRVIDRHNQRMHSIGHLSDNLWWADAVKRPYRCGYCGMGFSQSNGLRRHVAAYHDESLKNPCPSCDKTFACLGGLLRHRRRKHNYETPNARGQREEPYEMAPSTGSSRENAPNDSDGDKQASTSAAPQTEISPLQRTREWVNLLPATTGCDETAPAVDPHHHPYGSSVEYVDASGQADNCELSDATFGGMIHSTLGYDYGDSVAPADTNVVDSRTLDSPEVFAPAFHDTPYPPEDMLHIPDPENQAPAYYALAQDWLPPTNHYGFHSASTSRLSTPPEVTSLPPTADFAHEHYAPAAFDQPAYGWLADATTWSPDETNNASPDVFDFDYVDRRYQQPTVR
ncbi:hypothetical protein K523DRAFT_387320 [Schizophyllum commune Tattone D]|nr:hypothetical protein K523DRAFT_387320 [Schizophyllum commune Tattone D]